VPFCLDMGARHWIASSLVLTGACGYQAHDDGDVASSTEWIAGDAGIEEDEAPPVAPGRPDHYAPGHADPAVTAAIDAWRRRHERRGDVPSPDTSRCETRFADLEIAVPSHEDFRRLCQRCDLTDPTPRCEDMGRINACAPWGDPHDDDGHIGAFHALILIDATLAEDPRTFDGLVVHETIHHLGICTGYGADATHTDEALWGPHPNSIEARASRSL